MDQLIDRLFEFLSVAGKEVALFIVSMVPLIELRGSIPLGAALGMPWYTVLVISLIGNLIPVPFIIWFGRPLFKWLKQTKLLSGITHKVETRLMKKADQGDKIRTDRPLLVCGCSPARHRRLVWGRYRRVTWDANAPFLYLHRSRSGYRRSDYDFRLLWSPGSHQPVISKLRRGLTVG